MNIIFYDKLQYNPFIKVSMDLTKYYPIIKTFELIYKIFIK